MSKRTTKKTPARNRTTKRRCRHTGKGIVTAPRWIAEALDAVAWDQGRSFVEMSDAVANALIERLPLEAMAKAALSALDEVAANKPAEQHAIIATTAIIGVLTDGDPEVVQLTDLYQGACRALDAAGAPYETGGGEQLSVRLNLAGRILWLVEQGPDRIELQRVESERDLARTLHQDDMASRDAEIVKLVAERDDARRDNDQLRGAICALVEGDMPAGDVRRALAELTRG